jgi:hypothetical protein
MRTTNTSSRCLAATIGFAAALAGALPSISSAQGAPGDAATAPIAAAAAPAVQPGRVEPAFVQPLARLTKAPGPLRFEGVNAEHRLALPLSSRLTVREAHLRLVVTSSTALQEKVSSLAVLLNGRTIAQLPYRAEQPSFATDVPLPLDLLKPGYNDLRLRAVQHYTDKCERPDSPELWSEVDLLRSAVVLDASLAPIASTIGEIDGVFDPRLWAPVPLAIVTPAAPKDDALLQAAALAAEGVALRYRFHPTVARHVLAAASPAAPAGNLPGLDSTAISGGDAIVIGTRDQLAPYVAPAVAAQIGDSFLAVLPNDVDPSHAVVIVSGRTPDGVLRAAQVFALARGLPYPASGELQPSALAAPALPPYSRNRGAYPGRDIRFADLGLGDSTTTKEPIELEAWLPPDLFGRDKAEVRLHLNFAYTAGLRDDSSIRVLLNGLLSRPIRLSSPDGGSFDDYGVAIPLKSFRPGRNVISFAPDFHGLHEGECQQPVNASVTLRGDSTLVMPDAGHYTRLPDLARLAETLYPLAVRPDGADLSVRVLGADEDTLSAAWTLLAKLAQVNGYPLLATQVTRGSAAAGRHEIVLGAVTALAKPVLDGAPLDIGDPSVARYPTGLLPAGERPVAQELPRGTAAAGVDLAPTRDARAAVTMPRALGDFGLLMQYRREGAPSTLLVTASTPGLLRERVANLVSFEVWNGLQGDTVLWRATADSVVARELGEPWHVGDIGPEKKLEYWFSSYPWWWLAVVAGALVLAALLLRAAIVRRKADRHAGSAADREF